MINQSFLRNIFFKYDLIIFSKSVYNGCMCERITMQEILETIQKASKTFMFGHGCIE